MTPKKLTETLAKFQRPSVDHAKTSSREGEAAKNANLAEPTATYCFATSSSFSVGLTLSVAKVVCFLEPDYRQSTMLQGFARACRQGNKNQTTYAWCLLAKGNSIEQRIMENNRLRSEIAKTAERKISDEIEHDETALAAAGSSQVWGGDGFFDSEMEV
jgi:hypothetical protein